MNQSRLLHETILRDVVDVISDVKDFDQVEWIRNKNSVGSIARRASNLVLVFPVIVSNTLSIQTATIISKAIERKCVALLQILFASVNLSRAENLQDYISQFHSNLNKQLTLDDFMDAMDKLSESGEIDIINKEAYEAVKEDMHNINFYLSEELNPISINDYVSRTNIYGESTITLEHNQQALNEANSGKGKGGRNKNPYVLDDIDINKIVNTAVDKTRDAYANIANKELNKAIDLHNYAYDRKKDENLKDTVDYFRYQLLPTDVQKANELMPTLMTVSFTSYNGTGLKHTQTGIIGVKAKLYPVDAMDIVSRISSKYKDSNSLFNLVRASTREISFFKDFAFAVEKAKMDAINMARESNNAKIFKLLERRAAKNRLTALLKKNDASPITSLVMSQDEVEYLKKYSSIDMEKSYVTRSILEAYNLMDIVIADESLEIARFLFDDGDGVFEALSFDALEKEAKDSSYKKVVNLMNKMSR